MKHSTLLPAAATMPSAIVKKLRRRILSPALLCAGIASALVHASLFAVRVLPGPAHSARTPVVLLALLSPPVPAAAPSVDAMPEVVVPATTPAGIEPAPAPIRLVEATPQVVVPAAPPAVIAAVSAPLQSAQSATVSPPAGVASAIPGIYFIAAQKLVAMSRLGDLLDRTESEFPVEVQFPVRVHGEIMARYPEIALSQRQEGTVIAWVIVDAQANVEEIQIAEGDEVFHSAVVDAIRDAQFHPAADGGQGLRFPIALEFQFTLDAHPSGAPAAVASQ
jgi:TonB family protein